MRKRKIRKIGNSYYVKLEQTDMKDLNLEVGGEVEINTSSVINGCGDLVYQEGDAPVNSPTVYCGDNGYLCHNCFHNHGKVKA